MRNQIQTREFGSEKEWVIPATESGIQLKPPSNSANLSSPKTLLCYHIVTNHEEAASDRCWYSSNFQQPHLQILISTLTISCIIHRAALFTAASSTWASILCSFNRRVRQEELCQQCFRVHNRCFFSNCSAQVFRQSHCSMKKSDGFCFLFSLSSSILKGFIGFCCCGGNRHFLLRDAYDDMMLDGVQPSRDIFHSLIVGTMKGARLQDSFFFIDQMKTMGLVPDVCRWWVYYPRSVKTNLVLSRPLFGGRENEGKEKETTNFLFFFPFLSLFFLFWAMKTLTRPFQMSLLGSVQWRFFGQ